MTWYMGNICETPVPWKRLSSRAVDRYRSEVEDRGNERRARYYAQLLLREAAKAVFAASLQG